jgi:hypothetical protein
VNYLVHSQQIDDYNQCGRDPSFGLWLAVIEASSNSGIMVRFGLGEVVAGPA